MAEDYQKLYESLAQAAGVLEEENKRMMRELENFVLKEKQWQEEKAKQLAIFQFTLDQKNREHNEILQENETLREKLRQARSM